MKPINHRLITLADAINEFKIEVIFGNDFEEMITDRIDDDAEVLVFDGDTEFTSDINLTADAVFGAPYDRNNHPLIIVNGNLKACNIHMWRIDGLLVLGNLTCAKICLKEFYPVYVQGHLVANQAVLALAEQEGPFLGQENFGTKYARIQGTASSPRVQTWFMPLQHLNWTAGSGKEFAEDIENPNKSNWFSDPVWNM